MISSLILYISKLNIFFSSSESTKLVKKCCAMQLSCCVEAHLRVPTPRVSDLTIIGRIIAEFAVAQGHFPAVQMQHSPVSNRRHRKHVEVQV